MYDLKKKKKKKKSRMLLKYMRHWDFSIEVQYDISFLNI